MKCASAFIVSLLLLASPVSARDASPNFYLPEAASEKKAAPAEKSKPAPIETKVKEEEKTTPTPTPLPKRPAPVKKTPAPKPPQTPEEFKKSVISGLNLRARQNPPNRPFDPPLDPYGLARAFKQRWDFSSFLVTVEEELKFRLDAGRTRTLRLARAFSALSSEVEIRQRNLNSAALAAYLLSRDQHSWNPLQGRSLTEAQMLAVKATMRQDIKAMQSALTDYETLRNSLNASAEEVASLETKGLSGAPSTFPATADRPTVPTGELAAKRTRSILEERLVSVEALKATLAAENLSDAGDRRQSIASFAPPPPIGSRPSPPPRTGTTALPQVPSEDVMKAQPKGETIKAPERTALVLATDINAPVHAVRNGVVMYAGPFRGYGSMVIIEHEKGLFTVYSHLANIQVREREPVVAGSILGRAGIPPELGQSGIHFQVRQGKEALKVEDWLGAGQAEKLLTKR